MLTTGALAEMRTLLLKLRAERLAEVQLEVLLTQLAQAFTGRTGVLANVNATCDPRCAPPYAVKFCLLSHCPGGAQQRGQACQGHVRDHALLRHGRVRFVWR